MDADVAKLADAQPSEGCARKGMEVQLLSSAPTIIMRFLILSLVLAGLAGRALAGGFERIDPNKRADVTGQTVDFPTLKFETLTAPVCAQPVAPVGNQTVDRNVAVSTKYVATKTVNFTTREFAVVPFKNAPQKGFDTKPAEFDQSTVDHSNVEAKSAKIKPRVIRATTPAGDKELQDQINRIP